jgi:hypothetical protein
MSEIRKPIANVPLTTTSSPGILRGAKGCRFEPGLWLRKGEMYLMIMSQAEHVPYPPAGFYDVPDLGRVAYVKYFKPYQRSEYRTVTAQDIIESAGNEEVLSRLRKWRMFVFQAFEGDPPNDFVPDANFDYKRANIDRMVAELERRLQ